MSLFAVFPFLSQYYVVRPLFNLFLTVVFLAAVFAVLHDRRMRVLVGLLVAAAVSSGWVANFLTAPYVLLLARYTLQAVALSVVGGIILAHVLRDEEVTSDKICGAINVYLLMGLVWAAIFAAVETAQPGSFDLGGDAAAVSFEDRAAGFFYYSFITLSTLGYGDITPVSGPARALASLEAIAGQLYLTVLVARLVGLHISQSGRRD